MSKTQTDTSQAGCVERKLLDVIKQKNLIDLKKIIEDEKPDLNLNFVDSDELSPLQHACHIGDVAIARLLIDNGADVNFTQRKDGYTALMFAAIGCKADIVRLLLEHGVDTTVENCVNRNAAQMAAFVGQSMIVSIINSWIPYGSSIEPYTRVRELESQPRIPTEALGRLLHNFVVYPSLHPVKLMLFVKEHIDIAKYGLEFVYVLDDLCSKSTKPPTVDETLSLRYHYLGCVLQHCLKTLKEKRPLADGDSLNGKLSFDKETSERALQSAIRRLIKRAKPDEVQPLTPQVDAFITQCIYRFPYTQLPIFRTTTFALGKRPEPSDLIAYTILVQSLNGSGTYGYLPEACSVCKNIQNNKKCSRCQSVYYCDQSCQVIDWFQHKKVCQSPEEKPLLDSDELSQECEGHI